MSDKCPHHVLRNYSCSICERIWKDLKTFPPNTDTERLDWAILYDDFDRRPELFTDEATARSVFTERQVAWNCHLFHRADIDAAMPVEIGDLLAAWDLAHDALTTAADAARKLGHEPFAREAETIAESLEARVTALSNIARAKNAQTHKCNCEKRRKES